MAVGAARLCEENLKITLADCARFRALVGAADRAAALEHIYLDVLPPPADGNEYTVEEYQATLRPFALISSKEFARTSIAAGASVESGALEITLSANASGDPQTARNTFGDSLGLIADELEALSQQAGSVDSYLVMREVRVVDGPNLYSEEVRQSKGAYAWGVIEVRHGAE